MIETFRCGGAVHGQGATREIKALIKTRRPRGAENAARQNDRFVCGDSVESGRPGGVANGYASGVGYDDIVPVFRGGGRVPVAALMPGARRGIDPCDGPTVEESG